MAIIQTTLPFNMNEGGLSVVYNNELHIIREYDHYKWNGTEWVYVSTPLNFKNGSAIVYNDEIHVIGGDNGESHYKFNGTNWVKVANFTKGATCISASIYNNELHAIYIYDGTTYHVKFDGSSWGRASYVNVVTFSVNSLVSHDGELYIIGGSDDHTYWYKWDGVLQGSGWVGIGALPFAYTSGANTIYNDEIHIVDGTNHYKWNGTSWVSVSTLPYFIQYGNIVVLNNDLHILGGQLGHSRDIYAYDSTWKSGIYQSVTKLPTPTCTFTATGTDTGTLSNTSASMKYSVDGGATYTPIAGTSVSVSGVTTTNGIKVYAVGDNVTTLDSDVQTITVTQQQTPNVTVTQPTEPDSGGSINTGNNDEYSTDYGETFNDCGGEMTDVPAGTYEIRTKGDGSTLASETQTVNVTRYPKEVLDKDGLDHYEASVKSRLNGKETKFRYSTMPEANASNVGVVAQYIGTTNANYTKGYNYECKAQGTNPETYAWENVKVQPEPTVQGIGSVNITDISVEQNADFSLKDIIITYDDGFEIQPFASASWDNIAEVLRRYYSGEMTLNDVKQYWNIGDTKTISIGNISAPTDPNDNKNSAQTGKDVEFVIVGMNHDNLTTSIGSKQKSLFTLGTTLYNPFKISMINGASWYPDCIGRSYLNTEVYNAFPSNVKALMKTVAKDSYTTGKVATVVNDKLFLPSHTELLGSAWNDFTEGTQYAYYTDVNHRLKNMDNTRNNAYWTRTRNNEYDTGYIEYTGINTMISNTASTPQGMVIHFCL